MIATSMQKFIFDSASNRKKSFLSITPPLNVEMFYAFYSISGNKYW